MITHYHTVISGDLVASSQYNAAQYKQVLRTLENGLSALCTRFEGQFDMYRGDAFQCIFKQQEIPLHSALLMRLYLRAHSLDARISEAWGEVSQHRDDVKTATGPALVLSGKGLDELKNRRFALHYQQQQLRPSFALNIRFLDNLVSALSQKQANALYLYHGTEHTDHASIAKHLKTSRENVTKLLNAGHYHLLNDFLDVAKLERPHG